MGDLVRLAPRFAICSTLALLVACESDSSDDGTTSFDAGSSGTGGAPGTGGTVMATGGSKPSSGGGNSTGGVSSGAGGALGSDGATGGVPSVGGTPSTGGAPTGGGTNAGGATGGAPSTGGTPNTGGAPTGGATSTGGAPTGGAANTGGAPTGGATGTGGAPTGGTANTGGTSTGGSCTCQNGGSSGTGGSGGSQTPVVGGCPIFTPDDEWNRDVTGDSVDANWTAKLYANAKLKLLHPDFGSGFGIPFNVVPQNQTPLTISFDYANECDPGPYPFPGTSAKIEGGSPTSCSGDCHVLVVQQGACLLYEGWACSYSTSSSSWHCGSGAKFDLTQNSYGQRPLGWTSADAAGLAILPGLVKYAEVAAGSVNHAIRFTMHCTQDGFVKPASHQAVPGGTNGCPAGILQTDLRTQYPPMGLRIRLKSSYDISAMPTQAKIVAQAMKTYGMILADNGSDYFFQGDDDPGWNNTQLNALKAIPGDQFDVMVPGIIAH